MKRKDQGMQLSASDLSNYLNCHHYTELDKLLLDGKIKKPEFNNPHVSALQERGFEHEEGYVEYLRNQGLSVVEIPDTGTHSDRQQQTLNAMKDGADIITQGVLKNEMWLGFADILKKVKSNSSLGDFSYEVMDTKLSRETKAGTILQLSLYSEMLENMQGIAPERMWVVSPGEGFQEVAYRINDFSSYYRLVRSKLIASFNTQQSTYPEPVGHCDICRWFEVCNQQRREDDHLSFVAGLNTSQRKDLCQIGIDTLEKLATAQEGFYLKIEGVNVESILRSKEQARLQLDARVTGTPKCELLPIQEEKGLNRLPTPSEGDLFFDLEGDQYYGESGLEYLWGFSFLENGKLSYEYQWAHNYLEEKTCFEWFINFVVERKKTYPELKIYHYSAYEPSALKRLMGRYGVMEEQIDHLLRTNTFVDLYSITRQSVRAGIEKYSIKDLEQFYGYTRLADLRSVGQPKRFIEHSLELNKANLITPEAREVVRAYNQDDTDSTYHLRQWLEDLRISCEAEGETLTRPEETDGEVNEELSEALQRLNEIRQSLQDGLDPIPENRSRDEQASWLLGDLVSFYRREDKVNFWEKFRLKELDALELLEDKSGLSGLTFLETVGGTAKCPIDRYQFISQTAEIKNGTELFKEGHLRDEKVAAFGTIEKIDYETNIVDIKKRAASAELHPNACWGWKHLDKTEKTNRMLELAEFVIENSIDSADEKYHAARDILRGQNPRFKNPVDLDQEDTLKLAKEMALNLDHSYLAIQGPPGTGKSYSASRVVIELLKNGHRVGVTGLSHKVITNLMNKIAEAATNANLQFDLYQKTNAEDQTNEAIQYVGIKKGDLTAVTEQSGPWVLGGTDFMWSGTNFKESVDYLVVDEAGQFSLVGIMSIAHATKNIILLGDGAQLKQPIQGSHPEGCEVSALDHIVGDAQTIPKEKGVFLPITYRLHPNICAFNSELFYEGRLRAIAGNENQIIQGPSKFAGQALALENVEHWGNTNKAIEEVMRIQEIIKELCDGNHTYTLWQDNQCVTKTVTIESIMVVAPYNAQVNSIKKEMPDINVGTVDKFQGQEAPIVIYSVTTSSPEDAPRGMEFLYSGNRLNVAVSRAECLFIMVGCSKVFEPNCQRPSQMKLANAFCRFLEMLES